MRNFRREYQRRIWKAERNLKAKDQKLAAYNIEAVAKFGSLLQVKYYSKEASNIRKGICHLETAKERLRSCQTGWMREQQEMKRELNDRRLLARDDRHEEIDRLKFERRERMAAKLEKQRKKFLEDEQAVLRSRKLEEEFDANDQGRL